MALNQIAVFSGSFDPITLGHLDILQRAVKLFEKIFVVVSSNPDKRGLIPAESRLELFEMVLAEYSLQAQVSVVQADRALLADQAKDLDAGFIVRGLRNQSDLAYELPMAQMNRELSGCETVFLLADPAFSLTSSSLVRQVAALGGDVSHLVPGSVNSFLQNLAS